MRRASNDSIVRYCRQVSYQRRDDEDTTRAHKLDANAKLRHSAANSVVLYRDQHNLKRLAT